MARKSVRRKSASPREAKSQAAANAAAALAAEMEPGEVRPAQAIETNVRMARFLEAAIGKERARLSDTSRRLQDKDKPARLKARSALIFPQDRLGLERVVGKRDIVQLSYLYAALRAARAVCRIRVRGNSPAPPDFGTGFLVAPGVLLTNHHVLDLADTASLSLAEFNVELDLNFVEAQPRLFNLLPDRLFITSADLDFTFVAVNSIATDGTPLSTFGWLPLMRESGKGVNGEYASIIQHPNGEAKQIVLRENQIIALDPEIYQGIGSAFIHYRSDTERGSSGAPVFNDQFDVVALHHKAVPAYNKNGERLARDGTVWTSERGEDELRWVANEGVRISAIFSALDRMTLSHPQAGALMALLEHGEPGSLFSALDGRRGPIVRDVSEGEPLEATALARRKGYDSNFLGFAVLLPKMSKALKKKVAQLVDGSGHELKYTHFSVVMHAARRTPLFVAANIDGAKFLDPAVDPRWRIDKRIDPGHQSGNDLYSNNPFDKGHMVRRLDPAWGSQQDSDDGVTDTYHYTNAAPQEHSFNDGLWGDVEDYILGLAKEADHKITVFTGPVLDDDDREYGDQRPGGPWQIPVRFWKIICYEKADGTRSATGFLLDQADEIAGLLEGLTPLPRARETARVHQKAVTDIEALTKLDFGALRRFDPLRDLEATKRTRRIMLPANIVV
jgi:endonuclease G